jgi:hypothetical protein
MVGREAGIGGDLFAKLGNGAARILIAACQFLGNGLQSGRWRAIGILARSKTHGLRF